jgi:hypothetical protein
MNALILIGFGTWAYYGAEIPSKTALIPVGFGVVLLLLYPGVKKEDKIAAHAAVLLTLVILAGLVMPLKGILSTIAALIYFIKSFVDVRRARIAAGEGN